MDKRTKVVKSKSSNSAIQTKNDKQFNKKSRSNAGLQPLLQVKRRGVYVEKKPTKASIAAERCSGRSCKETIQPPPRPRPGQKNFLASVLTILSKSTTGTQYPDADILNQIPDNNKEAIVKLTRKKRHFKSKVLRNNNYQEDTLEVIQPKKEMIQTPSIFSEFSNKSYRPEYFDKPDDDDLIDESDDKSMREQKNSQLVREVLEGRMLNDKNTTKIEEPATLVSDKDEKGLYNFFVDLLETTFSGCNVKAELDAASDKSLNEAFAIDEKVAKKLMIAPDVFEEETENLKPFNSLKAEQEWDDDEDFDYFRASVSDAKTNVRSKKKRMKSQSFSFTNQWPHYPQSQVKPRKKSSRKHDKRDLLNLLKEELKMDVTLEEPQNLYQALKIMANNKRKNQKSLRFDESTKLGECIFKQRNLTSNTKSSSKNNDYCRNRTTSRRDIENFKSRQKFAIDQESTEGSTHSLEVFELDYDYPQKITQRKDEKEMLLTYRSSSSDSDDNFDPYDFNSECRSEVA